MDEGARWDWCNHRYLIDPFFGLWGFDIRGIYVGYFQASLVGRLNDEEEEEEEVEIYGYRND